MSRHLAGRLARLEARAGARVYVAEVGADWRGDVAAALDLTVQDGAMLVIVTRYDDSDAPPRLAAPPASLFAEPERAPA